MHEAWTRIRDSPAHFRLRPRGTGTRRPNRVYRYARRDAKPTTTDITKGTIHALEARGAIKVDGEGWLQALPAKPIPEGGPA